MKKIYTLLAVLILCVCFMFSGCTTKLDAPSGDVSSNGGTVVKVGDYVYFANAYIGYSTLKDGDNKESTVKETAIYRIKTENDVTVRDDDEQIENLEKVKAKIAGYETSAMFVVNSYLYFTSPNVHKTNTSENKFNLSTLFRIKLDGTGFKEILTTKTTAGKFYLSNDNTLYIFDDSKITKLQIKDNLSTQTTLVSDVSDVVFPTTFGKTLENIYYTVALTEDDGTTEGITGNKLYSYNIATSKSTIIRQVISETITLVSFDGTRLYYKRAVGSGGALIYSNTFVGGFEQNEIQHTFIADVTDFMPVITDSDGKVYVAYVYGKKLYLSKQGEEPTVVVSTITNLKMVEGDYLYYTTSEGIYRISYKDKKVQQVSNSTTISSSANFDFDGRYLYYYAQVDSNTSGTYYLHRTDVKTAELGRLRVEIFAYVLTADNG